MLGTGLGGSILVLRYGSGRRRRFSLEYKLRVLGEAGACKESGEVGALLLREGLYSSHPSAWRKQYQAGAFKGLKPSTDRVLLERITRLENENLRLREQLEEARVINEFPKKACEILGIPLKHHPSSADD